ncbi:MAG: PaaI family thioesterase [Bacteroidetes bacterium]|nr:PaaI family thioesterase [Bacteroidota bacterium]
MIKQESRNPEFKKYTEQKIAGNKFMNYLGFVFSRIEAGFVEGTMDFLEIHEQQNGWLHGGVTSALLDIVQGFAAYTLVTAEQQVFTVEAKVSYFNPGTAKRFFVRGSVAKPGNRFHFCEGEVYYLKEDGVEVIVAKGSSTMVIV